MHTELLVWNERAHLNTVHRANLGDNEVTNIFGCDIHITELVVLELGVVLEHLEH